jgi:hypothetical protein
MTIRITHSSPNGRRGCPRGAKCRHCTWDSLHITVDGPHPKYTKGHRGDYNGDIDRAIDDFLATLKREAPGNCATARKQPLPCASFTLRSVRRGKSNTAGKVGNRGL